MNIGRFVHVFYDRSRGDFDSSDMGRSIIISLFYPAETNAESPTVSSYARLFDPCAEMALASLKEMGADEEHIKSIGIPVVNQAEPMYTAEKRPVILYVPAFGIVRDMYMFQIENLVKQGFIVVTIGATDESMFSIYPDGRFIRQAGKMSSIESTDTVLWDELLQTRVEDILYTAAHLQELESCFSSPLMDMERIGLVGHSLGGAAVFEAVKRKADFRAAILLDPSFHLLHLQEGADIATPFLVMRQEKCTHEELKPQFSEVILNPFVDGYEGLYYYLSGYKSCLKVEGANHMTFSDVPLLFKEGEVSQVQRTISRYVTSFLREYVSNKLHEYQGGLLSETMNQDGVYKIDHRGNALNRKEV